MIADRNQLGIVGDVNRRCRRGRLVIVEQKCLLCARRSIRLTSDHTGRHSSEKCQGSLKARSN